MTISYSDPASNGTVTDIDYYDFSNIDDGVRQPTTPTETPGTSQAIYGRDKGDSGGHVTHNYDTLTVSGESATSVTHWRYRSGGVEEGGTWEDFDFDGALGAADSSGNVGSWRYSQWDVDVDLTSGVTPTAKYQLPTLVNGEQSTAFAGAYWEVEHSEPGGGGGGGSAGSPFLLFVE